MKHPSKLMLFFIAFNLNSAIGQNSKLSEHEFIFYIDSIEIPKRNVELSVITSGDTIRASKINGFYYFPIIDTSKLFDLQVKVDTITFLGQNYRPWVLNQGSKIFLAQLTQMKKLVSIAEFYSINEKDEDWELMSNRFFVGNRRYAIDIKNRNKIKELRVLIVNPSKSGSLLITQKIVE